MLPLLCAYTIIALWLLVVSRSVFVVLQPVLFAWYYVAAAILR